MIGFAMGLLRQGAWAALEYLANAVWQVPLVFAATWFAARLARRAGVAVEHRVWATALLLEAGLPAVRLDLRAIWDGMMALLVGRPAAHDGSVRVVMGAGVAHGDGLRLPASLLIGLAVSFAGVMVFLAARLAWGVWRTERMRRRAVPVVLGAAAARAWRRGGGESGYGLARAVEVRVSGSVSGPVTVGVLWPAVLLPMGFLESVSAEDLEAVLAHELAHVRRWDFAKNLVYEATSLVVAWHPAVWITRARVAESREMVCDAMAAGAVAGNESYARSLLRLAAMVADGAPARTFHAIGIFDANSFERRVMNLTKKRAEMKLMRRMGTFAVCAAMVVATCVAALALRVEVGPEMQAVAAASGAGPVTVKQDDLKSEYKKPPIYPAEAKAKKNTLNGPVVLAVIIGKDGMVEQIKVKKSLRADYDKSALDAVKDWKWQPYLLNGEPTEVDTTVTVNYSLSPDDGGKPQTLAVMVPVAPSGTENTAPKIIAAVNAHYPDEARARKDTLDGSVILEVTVGKDGSVNALHLDKGLRADYDKSAWAAVRDYRFAPARSNGEPVEAKIQVEVSFRND
jgi:TonB family protein